MDSFDKVFLMEATHLSIPDLILFTPKIFVDDRGYFYESFNHSIFEDTTGLDVRFVQDNHSQSKKGVLRGLHYQLPPKAQGKLVRVVHGEVFDVAVDIRTGSSTFGNWVGVRLSAENKQQLWIPKGFAHGFLTLSEKAEFLYKTTEYYAKEYERCIAWNDPYLSINWPLNGLMPVMSEKDRDGGLFSNADLFS